MAQVENKNALSKEKAFALAPVEVPALTIQLYHTKKINAFISSTKIKVLKKCPYALEVKNDSNTDSLHLVLVPSHLSPYVILYLMVCVVFCLMTFANSLLSPTLKKLGLAASVMSTSAKSSIRIFNVLLDAVVLENKTFI